MSGWGFNLSNLKSLGDKLQDGLSELERNLAQPVVRNDPPPRSSSSTDLNRSTNSPSRTNSISSPSRASRPTPHPLVTEGGTPRGSVDSVRSNDTGAGAGSPNAERSASELATGAMSSLREQLRRKRLAAEAARNGGSPQPQGVVVKLREEPPTPTTPTQGETKQDQLIDISTAEETRPDPPKRQVSLMDADDDDQLPTPATVVGNEPPTSLVDDNSAIPSSLQTPIQAGAPISAPTEEPATTLDTDTTPLTLTEPTPPSPPLPSAPAPEPGPTTTRPELSPSPAESHAPEPAPAVDDSAEALPFDVEPAAAAAKDLLRPTSPDLFAIASTADATPLDALTREATPAPEPKAELEAKDEPLEGDADDADGWGLEPEEAEEPVAEAGSLEKPDEPEEAAKMADEPEIKAEPVKEALPVVEADEHEPEVAVKAEESEDKEPDTKEEDVAAPAEAAPEPEPVSEVQVVTSEGVDPDEVDQPAEDGNLKPDEATRNGIPNVDESAPTIEAINEGRDIPDASNQEANLEQAKAEDAAEAAAAELEIEEPAKGEDAAPALPAEEVAVIEDLVGEEAVQVKLEEPELAVVAEPSQTQLEPESAPVAEEPAAASPVEEAVAVKAEEATPEPVVEEAAPAAPSEPIIKAEEPAAEPEAAPEVPAAAEEPAVKIEDDKPLTYAEVAAAEPEPEPEADTKPALELERAPESELAPELEAEPEAPPAPVAKDEPAPPAAATPVLDARLSEITAAYERLETLKTTLDRIVSEVTPLANVDDVDAFEGELRTMKGKAEMSMKEIGKLTGDLNLQKERFAELREAHRQESRSQTERIDDLAAQVASKDAALATLAAKLEKAEAANAAYKAEVSKLNEEAIKLKQTAKDEEEKRTKALSLLRALRQKLVKTEKDKDEAEKARDELQARAKEAGEGSKAERVRFEQEVVSLRAAQQSEIAKLRASFEKDVQAQKAALERDANAKKAQFELDAITAKAQHDKELKAKDTRVAQLEKTVKELGTARDELFEQLQLRTAEAESAGAHQQSLQGQTGELQYELQEARDRAAALLEEVEELRKAKRDGARDEVNVRRLLAEAEARHEAKIRDLTARARGMEKERQEAADEASKQLAERLKEVERMRETIAQKDKEYEQSVSSAKVSEGKIAEAEKRRVAVEKELKEVKGLLASVKEDQAEAGRVEAGLREELAERAGRAQEVEKRLEEVVTKESELRSKNKILRDELRKLQSGVALRETARAPGVGYFAQHSQGAPPTAAATASTSVSTPASGPMSPQSENGVASPALNESRGRTGSIYGGSTLSLVPGGTGADLKQASEEAINFEYLRNLLLQFLEKPEMRPHLISVMSVVMRFTPAEQRRLVAKAGGK